MATQDIEQAAVAAQPQPPTPLVGMAALLVVIVVVGAFLALCSALHMVESYVGFFFLLYWAAFEHMATNSTPAGVVRRLCRVGPRVLASPARRPFGNAATWVFLAILLVAVYCQIMKWLAVVINNATMLFLTVGTIIYV